MLHFIAWCGLDEAKAQVTEPEPVSNWWFLRRRRDSVYLTFSRARRRSHRPALQD